MSLTQIQFEDISETCYTAVSEPNKLVITDNSGKIPSSMIPTSTDVPAHTHTQSQIAGLTESLNAKAPAYTYSTTDLTSGTSALDTGKLYIVYE